ncbi:MAG: hypothetical protein QF645_07405 [Planctomycetota bacterium]|nr:hypothetical protein [Planctomycetota bacterium]
MVGATALANNPGSLGSLYAPALALSSGSASLQTSVTATNLPDGTQVFGLAATPSSGSSTPSPAEIISSSVLGTLLDISA